MSSVDKKDEKLYVVTYKELIFIFIVFSAILIVLYPKDLLKQQILAENSNYDLSMLYLKNLLKHSPEDESLMLILAEQSLRSGKKDLSLRLLELLLQSKNDEYRKKAILLSYILKKDNYYYVTKVNEQEKIKQELKVLFQSIYQGKMYDKNDIKKWYEESLFVNNEKATHYFLRLLLEDDKSNITLLEKAYYLELKMHHQQHALAVVKKLQKYDLARRDKWIEDEYYTYINFKQYKKAEKLLVHYAENSKVWQNRLASFYLMRKEFHKASAIYETLFKNTVNYKQKRTYFYKLVKALQAGNYLVQAAQKTRKYEADYFNDLDARNFMLKTYMACGRLDYAAKLSKKILAKEFR